MSNDTKLDPVQKIKKTYGNVTVIVGTTLVLTLCGYFFFFSKLFDTGHILLMWFQVLTMVLALAGLIFLKRFSLFLTRILLASNEVCSRALKGMTLADIEKD